ncbi:MAG TPA: TIGR04053 family radical SAM/SPASM domain-containing protein [Polyangiaceae bacterium]
MQPNQTSQKVPAHLIFDQAPRRIYWEVTRACALACRHCRADASPSPDPCELSPEEGLQLLDRIAAFGAPRPHVIFTGGDPLERADLFELIAYARSRGLGVSVSPSATPKLTPAVIRRFRDAGVEAISLSIDRTTAEDHDALRGVEGCAERTIAAALAAREAGLPLQVNTLVAAETVDDMPGIYRLACDLGAARWSLFFLVSVGRGTVLQPIDAQRAEKLLGWLADLPREQGGPFVTTTEAPHFRRVLLERRSLPQVATARAGFGIRDGNGVLFVSHTGYVSPSGFLPVAAGNVRREDIVGIYRSSPMFVSLRDARSFHGRCGMCEYHAMCGGSRARAWAASEDILAEDPLCEYQPGGAKER